MCTQRIQICEIIDDSPKCYANQLIYDFRYNPQFNTIWNFTTLSTRTLYYIARTEFEEKKSNVESNPQNTTWLLKAARLAESYERIKNGHNTLRRDTLHNSFNNKLVSYILYFDFLLFNFI